MDKTPVDPIAGRPFHHNGHILSPDAGVSPVERTFSDVLPLHTADYDLRCGGRYPAGYILQTPVSPAGFLARHGYAVLQLPVRGVSHMGLLFYK